MSKENPKIFVVEDEAAFGNKIVTFLTDNFPEYEVHKFEKGKDCIKNLYLNPDIITLDYIRSDMSSRDVFKAIQNYNPEIPIIIISAQKNIKVAVEMIREGAYSYIIKDSDWTMRLQNEIQIIQENQKLKKEVTILKKEITDKYRYSKILIGVSKKMEKVFTLIDKASVTNILATIHGETGTGKDLVAKAIHYNSAFRNGSFVVVNMAAIPSELVESELFGHERGSFTGAITRRIGKFEQASNGTIFLDEIAETPLTLQTKLLRVLQDKEVIRVGGNTTIKVNTRIIVATNKNLKEEVKKGNFREDLFYRLLGFPIFIHPLRERGDDILILAKYFLNMFCKQNNMAKISITVEAQNALLRYSWPGNVRELKAIVERSAVMTNTDTITEDNLNFSTPLGDPISNLIAHEMTMEEYKQEILQDFLKKYDHDIDIVAEKLDISKATIYRMIKNVPVVQD